MFTKRHTHKTSAPLRASDRRKFRNSIASTFLTNANANANIDGDDPSKTKELAELLVPDGLLMSKFTTSGGEQGVIIDSDSGGSSDPLWFTLDAKHRGSAGVTVPALYTLWKIELLPILTTPGPAMENLIGGADLMTPGVIEGHADNLHSMPSIPQNALVAIASSTSPRIPLAVGRMLISSSEIKPGTKGKAVEVFHTWKDKLWEAGSARTPPEAGTVPTVQSMLDSITAAAAAAAANVEDITANSGGTQHDLPLPLATLGVTDAASPHELSGPSTSTSAQERQLTSSEADAILQEALLQALTSLAHDPVSASKSPPATLPMPASTFYSSYILPSRRPEPAEGENPSSSSTALPRYPAADLIKRSSHKKLSKFLQQAAKLGLIAIKEPGNKKGDQSEIQITALATPLTHPSVDAHRPYKTRGDVERKDLKAEARRKEEEERKEEAGRGINVRETWRAIAPGVITFFQEATSNTSVAGNSTASQSIKNIHCTANELRALLESYISSHSLVHPRDRKYITLDETLRDALLKKGEEIEYLERDECIGRLKAAMQAWHEVQRPGKESVRRKGELKPISITCKLRLGRKVATLITGIEPFGLSADELAEELRRSCASATSVTPLPGKTAGVEVLVQGKHVAAVTELLLAQGVSKKWIESSDLTASKKKK